VIVFERSDLVFIFSFNSCKSFTDYQIGVKRSGRYQIVLDSDRDYFGGHNRVDSSTIFTSFELPIDGRNNSIKIYLPNRTALVLRKCD